MDESDQINKKKESQSDDPNDDLDDQFEDLDELVSMVDEFSSYDTPSDTISEYDDSFENCQVCGEELINGECISCSERDARESGYIEDEKDDFKEDDYQQWRRELKSKGELNLFGIFCVVVTAIYLIYISFPEVLSIMTGEFILEQFALYFTLLIIGIGALFGGLVMARHVIIYGRLFDTTFEKEIYSRLEPAFAEVGNIKGDLQEIYDRMERMNINMKRLERETRTVTGISDVTMRTYNTAGYIFLMILSLGVFFYVLRYPGDYVPYPLTALFLIWWAGVTSDFKLWKISVSWSWAFFAVVVVPISAILISVIYGIGFTTGVIGIALTVYTLSYYTWAKYYVEGTTLDILSSLGDEE
jgi:hypothetical protein